MKKIVDHVLLNTSNVGALLGIVIIAFVK